MTILSSVPGSAFAARSVDIYSIHTSRASRKIRLFDGLRAGRGGCLVRAAERAGAPVQELSSLLASYHRHFPLMRQYYCTLISCFWLTALKTLVTSCLSK